MIVCDHCQRYATSACRSCIYFSDIYGSITGDYYVEQVTPEEADHELHELYPEDFHGKFATKVILAYRFVSRVLLPFLFYEKWNRPRQYIKGAYYPKQIEKQVPQEGGGIQIMTQEELDKIVEQHQHWLKADCEGWEDMRTNLSGTDLSGVDLSVANLREVNLRRANLCGANLYGTDLCGANLREVNLSEADLRRVNLYGTDLSEVNLRKANLSGADLRGVNLSGADLYGTDLYGADLRGANLIGANLSGANLRGTNLSGANLRGADLSGADLSVANLREVNLSEANKFRLGKVLDEPLTGYKKTKEGVVITAEIPIGAVVFCINGSKCRTNRAKITDMGGHDVLHSRYDNSFEYRLGQEIEIKDFNLMYNVECASGFHFFKTRKEAEEYDG